MQVDVTGAAAGTYVNTSGSLTSSLGDSGTASDTLDIVGGELTVTKSFSGTVVPGGTIDLQFTLTTGPSYGVSGISFTDDLDAVLPGLVAVSGPAAGFCGAGSQLTGTSVLSVMGASLPASSSCTFSVTLLVPDDVTPGSYANVTSTATGTRTGGAPVTAGAATADLVIEPEVPIPALSLWGLLALVGLLAGLGWTRLR